MLMLELRVKNPCGGGIDIAKTPKNMLKKHYSSVINKLPHQNVIKD